MDSRIIRDTKSQATRRGDQGTRLTVEVMSTEQTSQIYLTPPSLPRVAVFFLMTAMVAVEDQCNKGTVRGFLSKRGDMYISPAVQGRGAVACHQMDHAKGEAYNKDQYLMIRRVKLMTLRCLEMRVIGRGRFFGFNCETLNVHADAAQQLWSLARQERTLDNLMYICTVYVVCTLCLRPGAKPKLSTDKE